MIRNKLSELLGPIALTALLLWIVIGFQTKTGPPDRSLCAADLKLLGLAAAQYWSEYGAFPGNSTGRRNAVDKWQVCLERFAQETHLPLEFTSKHRKGHDGEFVRLAMPAESGRVKAVEYPFVLLEVISSSNEPSWELDARELQRELDQGGWSCLRNYGKTTPILLVKQQRPGSDDISEAISVRWLSRDEIHTFVKNYIGR